MLVALSMPFMATMTHGQNSGTSLLILTGSVWVWRQGKGLLAGLVGGLLFYKPQLAIVLAAVMVIDLGWDAVMGFVLTGAALLTINLAVLPGTLGQFLHQVPANLQFVQEQSAYPWTRHVTLKALLRVMIQGTDIGPTTTLVSIISSAGMIAFAVLLGTAAIRVRGTIQRDRLIAATVVATPLVMPFYFDYDLLLMAVPVVLIAAEILQRGDVRMRHLVIKLIVALYLVLLFNPDLTGAFQINFAAILLAGLAGTLILGLNRKEEPAEIRQPALLAA